MAKGLYGVLTIGVGMAAFTSPAFAGEAEMNALVARKAAILSNMHRKARKALVNAGQDKIFPSFFQAADDGSRAQAKAKIEQTTLVVQSRFHVEEMCLIDKDGPELTRIVGRQIAPDSDLSPDESGAAFFKPGFAEKPKRAYISQPYMSPDANKWVLAYTTVVMVDGAKQAILHYEHGLEVFQDALSRDVAGTDRFILAVSKDGYVISDSRKVLNNDMQGEKESLGDYYQTLEAATGKAVAGVFQGIGSGKKGSAIVKEGGAEYAVAYARVAGDWTLLAIERQ